MTATEMVTRSDVREMVARANRIPVTSVLTDHFGVVCPSEIPEGQSWKTNCPFSWEHGDGGIDKNFRVYGATNQCYCFAMHGGMNPVRLFQIKTGCRPAEAARQLLEAYNIPLASRLWRERYQELLVQREQRQNGVGSTQTFVAALHAHLSRHPAYASRQLDADVASELEDRLAVLDELVTSRASDESIVKWYQEAKKALWRLIDGGHGG